MCVQSGTVPIRTEVQRWVYVCVCFGVFWGVSEYESDPSSHQSLCHASFQADHVAAPVWGQSWSLNRIFPPIFQIYAGINLEIWAVFTLIYGRCEGR